MPVSPLNPGCQRLPRASSALLLGCLALAWPVTVMAAVPEGTWMIAQRAAVRIFDCGGLLCGQVVWLRNPALRTREICGRTIIWGLRPSGDGQWSGGWFYDPENGKTYNVSATLISPDEIRTNVYLGLSFLGETETLRRTPINSLDGRC